MMQRTLILLWAGAAAFAAEAPPCASVEGDQILGADLGRAAPAFRALPPDVRLAPAPLPGGIRVFSEPELESLGARFGIRVDILSRAVCFRVPTAPLNREAVIAAMRRALPSRETQIELTEVSPEPAPPGILQFSLQDLGRPAASEAAALWRGEVVSGNRRFNIWARARISTSVQRVIATAPLKAGVAIQADQFRVETSQGFPALNNATAPALESIVGMAPLRPVSANSEIRSDNLARPLDIVRGDIVQVDVRMGPAHLSLNGRAETAGRVGQMIAVRNPETSRVFQARVEARGRVLVDPRNHGAQ